MLSDRSYMREDYPRRGGAALPWLISAIIGGFVLEAVFRLLFLSPLFGNLLSLSFQGLSRWYVWQFFTYSFISPAGEPAAVLVVGFNLLVLYFLGKDLEALLGTRRFVALYTGAVLLGALAWVAVNQRFGGQLFGAWPGIAGLFTLFACLNWNQPMRMLVFFVPVTLKPKYLFLGLLAIEIVGLVTGEMLGRASFFGLHHSAHLGGMFAGFLYFRIVHQREWRNPDGKAQVELPRWLRKAKKTAAATPEPIKYTVNLTTREDLRGEVDRILDKINSEGLAALTPEEKRLLDEAKDQLSRR